MGGDLIPLPLVRLRGKPPDTWPKEVLVGGGGFELPRTVKVHSRCLGQVQLCCNVVVFALMTVWVFWADKSYLTHAKIQGYSRVTLQHPVHNCNPLHSHCKTNMTAMDQLPYCKGDITHGGSDDKEKNVHCKYLDTFDVDHLNTGLSLGRILIPTRISTFEQKVNKECARRELPCKNPYEVTDEKHDFVADIEDFTVLIDHGFSCKELDLKGAAWSLIGFYVPFMPGGKTDWDWPKDYLHKRPKPKFIPCDDPDDDDCPYSKKHRQMDKSKSSKMRIPHLHRGHNFLNRTTDNYDSSGQGARMYATPYGDIVKVSDLLQIAGVDLDAKNYGKQNLREEGEVIVIEISYTNFNYYHWPNDLYPVYEYRIFSIPADSYKYTRVEDTREGNRLITDVHGLEIVTRVEGTLGKWSFKTLTISLVELSILLGTVQWLLHCCALNFGSKQGKKIEELLVHDVELEDSAIESAAE